MMNCEQVFDVLTRGPFPTGQRTDDQVEAHLARCHECRQLAEALRPATDLLHESLSGSSAESLPGYTGTLEQQTSHDLSAAVTLMLDEASVQEPHAVPKRKSEARRPPAKSWAAGVLCTAAVGLLVIWGWSNAARQLRHNAPPRPEFTTLQLAGHAELTTEGVRFLNELQLPSACSEPSVDAPPPTARSANQSLWTQCCTKCHASERSQPATSNQIVTKMAASCRICHAQSTASPKPHNREVSAQTINSVKLSCNL